MVPTIPISSFPNWWYVSFGKVKLNLVAVYRNGTEETANWTLTTTETNGRFYTILIDDTDTADQEADTVYADLDGVEVTGDGVGALLSDPADILQHFLTNFTFNAWPTGSTGIAGEWLNVSTAPINATHFATTDTFFGNRQYAASRVLTTDDRGIDVLNDFCESHKVAPFWASDWTLGILPIDHSPLDLDTGRLIRLEDVRGESSAVPRVDSLLNRLEVKWLRDQAAGQLRKGPIGIYDTNRTPIISESLDLNWVEASLV